VRLSAAILGVIISSLLVIDIHRAWSCDNQCRQTRWFNNPKSGCYEHDLNTCLECITGGGCTEDTFPGYDRQTCTETILAIRIRLLPTGEVCGILCPIPTPPDTTQADFIGDPSATWLDTGTHKWTCQRPDD
jgi:hypothetical protein